MSLYKEFDADGGNKRCAMITVGSAEIETLPRNDKLNSR